MEDKLGGGVEDNKRYSVKEFGEIVGACVMTLYRWEKTGLLVPHRTKSNRKYYTKEHIDIFLKGFDVGKDIGRDVIINKIYTAKEFSHIVGVNLVTLYRWEKSGKIVPNRTVSNRKYYTDEHIAKYLGMGINE